MKTTAENHKMPLPVHYNEWRKKIVAMIENAKLHATFHVNADMLQLYWQIGQDILIKQKEQGWGAQVIAQLAKDLSTRFPDDRGYSPRNLGYMPLLILTFQFCKCHLQNSRRSPSHKRRSPN